MMRTGNNQKLNSRLILENIPANFFKPICICMTLQYIIAKKEGVNSPHVREVVSSTVPDFINFHVNL